MANMQLICWALLKSQSIFIVFCLFVNYIGNDKPAGPSTLSDEDDSNDENDIVGKHIYQITGF